MMSGTCVISCSARGFSSQGTCLHAPRLKAGVPFLCKRVKGENVGPAAIGVSSPGRALLNRGRMRDSFDKLVHHSSPPQSALSSQSAAFSRMSAARQ